MPSELLPKLPSLNKDGTVKSPAKPILPANHRMESKSSTALGKRESNSRDDEPQKKRGRRPGSTNYTQDDLDKMVGFIDMIQPVTPDQWEDVLERFNTWAKSSGRPIRDVDAFKRKFEKLVNSKSEDTESPEGKVANRARQVGSSLAAQKHPAGTAGGAAAASTSAGASSKTSTKAGKGEKGTKKLGKKGLKAKAASSGTAALASADPNKNKLMTFFQSNLSPALQAMQSKIDYELTTMQARFEQQLNSNQSRLEHQLADLRFLLQQHQVHMQVMLQQLQTIHAIIMMSTREPTYMDPSAGGGVPSGGQHPGMHQGHMMQQQQQQQLQEPKPTERKSKKKLTKSA